MNAQQLFSLENAIAVQDAVFSTLNRVVALLSFLLLGDYCIFSFLFRCFLFRSLLLVFPSFLLQL